MLNMTVKLLVGGTFDAVVLIFMGLALLGIERKFEYYYKIIPCYILGIYIFTMSINLHGLHPFALLILLILLIKYIVKLDWISSFMAAIISYILLYLGDVVFLIFIDYSNYSFIAVQEMMAKSPIYFVLFFLLVRLPVIIVALFIYHFKFRVINLSGDNDE